MIKLDITITVSRDLAGMLSGSVVDRAMRAAATDLCKLARNHFIDRAQATESRRYWGQAAESTQVTHLPGQSLITIAQRGVRLHWRGGTVKPTGQISEVTGRPIKSLLVPFEDSILRKRGATLAEAGLPPDEVQVLKSEAGNPYLAWIRPPQGKTARSKSKVFPLGALLKQTKHNPDPTVLPSSDDMVRTVKATAIDIITHHIQQRTP